MLGYTGALPVEAACAHVAVPRGAIAADGLVGDPALVAQIAGVLAALSASG